ncbi:hypothetical protein ACSFVZ_13135 [Pseudoalteromonas sp. SYSU M81236]|uniref:hypothetical protein n=1 Tax=Pseudoalteromonas sp. SYSU M81236 TaxID=3447014 RepID=UPI003F03FEE1
MYEDKLLIEANSLINTIKASRNKALSEKDFRKKLFDLDIYCTMHGKASYKEITDHEMLGLLLMELSEYVSDGTITFKEFNYVLANVRVWVNAKSASKNPINIDLAREVFDSKYFPPPRAFSRFSNQANQLRLKGLQFNSIKIYKKQAESLAFKFMDGFLAVGATKKDASIFSAYLVSKIWGGKCGLKQIPYKAAVIKRNYSKTAKVMIIEGKSRTDYMKALIDSEPEYKKGWLYELDSLRENVDINSLHEDLVGDDY